MDALTPYGIAVRYPNELDIEERHVRNALLYAKEIVGWAEKIVEQKDRIPDGINRGREDVKRIPEALV